VGGCGSEARPLETAGPAGLASARVVRLPATGSLVVALPMKIEGGSGGPLRIVAFLP
jgi:kynurenine formamidase